MYLRLAKLRRMRMKYLINNQMNSTLEVEKHFGSDLVLASFFTFVVLMVLLHCILKNRQNKYIDNMDSINIYKFEWEDDIER